jgi:metal-dependent amidase/aminoacylase/carboxypeptidase family protein
VIPDYTAARLSVRALDIEVMAGLVERVKECIEGAARSTGCTCEIAVAGPIYKGLVPNYSLAGVFQKHAESLGVVIDDRDEMKYIGSSDIGNVSRVLPALHPEFSIAGIDHLPHTPGFAEAARSETGEEVMKIAAKALALTGLEVLTDSELRAQMIGEFQKQRARKTGGSADETLED